MLSGIKPIAVPTPLSKYAPEEPHSAGLALVSASLVFWHLQFGLAQEGKTMAHPRPSSEARDNSELWFTMSSSTRREREHQETFNNLTAYQEPSSGPRTYRPSSSSTNPPIPFIATPDHLNKPLPPSPPGSERRSRRIPAPIRPGLSESPDPSYLQAPHSAHQRPSSANDSLRPDRYQYPQPHHQSSRSMPSSPLESTYPTYYAPALARAVSATANYSESAQYPYQSQFEPQDNQFVSQPPRTRRTFPEETTSPTLPVQRQRPHTWLSSSTAESNEPFHDQSDVRLFVEATSGLPPASYNFSTMSPTSPPHMQGSHFNRGHQNDRIPIPLQHPQRAQSYHPGTSTWQNTDYYAPRQPSNPPMVSSSALPRRDPYASSQLPPSMHSLNLELEVLGLQEEEQPEDELPDYAQSQAEMDARRRKAATARARELEARWRRADH